jgi:ATP-dependent protease ClpP protease subunit
VKVVNFAIKRGLTGKHLDLQIHGTIDGGWFDDEGANSKQVCALLNEHADASTVRVDVNSIGGSMFGGIAMHNALAAHPGKVTGVVTGLAASAASLAVLGCDEVVMAAGSMMMIHPPSIVAAGNASDLRKSADMLDKAQASIVAIYAEKTGKSTDEINALVNAETWMTGEEAVAAGFADALADDEPDEDDPNEDAEPEDRGDVICWNGVSFPRAAMPAQVLAMAKTPPPIAPPIIDRAYLEAHAPDLLAALVAEPSADAKAAIEFRAAAMTLAGASDAEAAINIFRSGVDALAAAEAAKVQAALAAKNEARAGIVAKVQAAVESGRLSLAEAGSLADFMSSDAEADKLRAALSQTMPDPADSTKTIAAPVTLSATLAALGSLEFDARDVKRIGAFLDAKAPVMPVAHTGPAPTPKNFDKVNEQLAALAVQQGLDPALVAEHAALKSDLSVEAMAKIAAEKAGKKEARS